MIHEYMEAKKSLEFYSLRLYDIKREIDTLAEMMYNPPSDLKGVDYAKQPGGNITIIPFAIIWDRIKKLKRQEQLILTTIEEKRKRLEKMETLLEEAKGKNYKILYWRLIEGWTQEAIAEEVGMSDRQVRRILKKHLEEV